MPGEGTCEHHFGNGRGIIGSQYKLRRLVHAGLLLKGVPSLGSSLDNKAGNGCVEVTVGQLPMPPPTPLLAKGITSLVPP